MRRKSQRRGDWIYRILLRLFPFDFQREYGSDMEATFRDERLDAEKRGRGYSMRLWWRTLKGFLQIAPREHVDVLRQDLRYGLRSLAKRPGFAIIAIFALAIRLEGCIRNFMFPQAHFLDSCC